MTIDDYRWLVSEAAQPWLAVVRDELSAAHGVTTSILTRLRKELSSQRAHLVVEQVELRKRAREKFSRAEEMFFTRQGLEQATDERIATYKARRFPAGQEIADLCCGIGGDLVSLANRSSAVGVDRDHITAALAQANARVHGLSSEKCQVVVQDVVQFLVDSRVWHCDPDRRAEGRRSTQSECFQPPVDALQRLLDRSKTAAIKLAPATQSPEVWRETAELEWIGSRDECRQQVAWLGDLARHPGRRAATIVDAVSGVRTVVGDPSELPPPATDLGNFLYEPHAAILAAKLTASLCSQFGLNPVSAGVAYLTADYLISDGALDGFEVLDLMPLDRKQLKAYCRERGIGRLEIKKRGVEVDPSQLRKEIIAQGDAEATMIVTPVRDKVKVVVARRLCHSGVQPASQ